MDKKREMIFYHGNDGSLGKDGESISILTYNLLAPHLSTHLVWDDRKVKLLAEIVQYNADIVCLQEIIEDQVDSYFGPAMENHGYNFIINTELVDVFFGPDTPPIKMGCAIFYKRLSFRVKKEYKIDFLEAATQFLKENELDKHPRGHRYKKKKPGIGCLLELLPLKKKLIVCVVTVHLTSAAHFPDLKALQTYLLLKGLTLIQEANIPLIVAGDFNIVPKSETYMMITRRKMPTEEGGEANCNEGIDLRTLLRLPNAAPLESAYSTILKSGSRAGLKECRRINEMTMEPKFTTASKRPYPFKDTIDYIFFTGEDFTVDGILELIDDVEELPNEDWPSDHIALMAHMLLKKKRKGNNRSATLPENPWLLQDGGETSRSQENASDNIQGESSRTVQGESSSTVQGDGSRTVQGESSRTVQGESSSTMQGESSYTVQGESSHTKKEDDSNPSRKIFLVPSRKLSFIRPRKTIHKKVWKKNRCLNA